MTAKPNKPENMSTFLVTFNRINRETIEVRASCKATAIDSAIEKWCRSCAPPVVLMVAEKPNPPTRKKRLRCKWCRTTKGVKMQEDPYDADLHGDYKKVPMCDACCKDRAQEL